MPKDKDAPEWGQDWADWVRDWTISLDHGHSPQTVTTYLRGVRQFTTWLRQHHAEVDAPEKVTTRHVEAWLGALAKDGKGAATRRVRLMTLRSFFGWVLKEPATPLTVDPAAAVVPPDVPMPPVQVVRDDQLSAVLATCDANTFIDLRDAAILRLLISCGLRRAELVGLNVEGVDITHGELLVMGKGSKPRTVTISGSKATLAISRYLRLRRKHPLAATTNAVFLSSRTTGAGDVRLTGGAVALMIHRRCRLAGVEEFHPHALRHYWADACKQANLSDEDLERMAGWSSPLMVRRYGRALADQRARDQHKRLNVGDRV